MLFPDGPSQPGDRCLPSLPRQARKVAVPAGHGGGEPGPKVAPTPQPPHAVPVSGPIGPRRPAPPGRQPCCGGAREWSRKGTPESSE